MQNQGNERLFELEDERLRVLYDYQILDTAPEEKYNALLNLAVSIFRVSIATIAFIDRDRTWFKARVGVPVPEIERANTLCHLTIQSDSILEIPDIAATEYFTIIPMTAQMGVRFYAAAPIVNAYGIRLGTICLFSDEPRQLTPQERQMLHTLAQQVMALVELDAQKRKLEAENQKAAASAQRLAAYKAELNQLSYTLSHELKTPLRAIHNLAEWISEDLTEESHEQVRQNLALLRGRAQRLENLFNGLITYSRAREVTAPLETVATSLMLQQLCDTLREDHLVTVTLATDLPVIRTERPVLETIFSQLLENAILHNPGRAVEIEVGWRQQTPFLLEFYVQDNGVGIAPVFHEKIFGMFKTLSSKHEQDRNGVGLAYIKKLLNERQATIWVDSIPEQGCRFSFTWPC